MNKYKVLWFDDEYPRLENIKEMASLCDIDLIGFSNAEEGLNDLKEYKYHYDAILMDGLFYKNSEDESGNIVSQTPFMMVMIEIEKLKDQKVLPTFILSGQQQFTKIKNEAVEAFQDNHRVYDKLIENDLTDLWNDIKIKADQNDYTQIKHQHKDVFEIFELSFLDRKVEAQLLQLLHSPSPVSSVEQKGMLSTIRAIMESYMAELVENKVIPESISGHYSEIFKHLSGNEIKPEYKPTTKVYQNKSILNLHKWVYYTCGSYIHNLSDKDYHNYMISNYAIESVKSGLLELLIWFKKTMIIVKTNEN